MRAVIQRVNSASVTISGKEVAAIGSGLMVLLGIETADTEQDAEWLANKMVRLRIFSDANGVMNRNVQDINGKVLVVSQFTLHAGTKKGNRPSYIRAARPEQAIPLYEKFVSLLKAAGIETQTGRFGANMQVLLENDGPVTIIMDTKNKE